MLYNIKTFALASLFAAAGALGANAQDAHNCAKHPEGSNKCCGSGCEVSSTIVFKGGEDGSKFYRIPALETASDGSLIAITDRRGDSNGDLPNIISVVAKRSTDGGKTWSAPIYIAKGDAATGKTYGDAAVVRDRNTGDLVCVYSGDQGFWTSTQEAHDGFYVSFSKDNGLTWTEPKDISDMIYGDNWHGAFAASGSMYQARDGRIMFVANTRLTPERGDFNNIYEFVCSSSDGGHTWEVLGRDARVPFAAHGDETKVIENSKGELMLSVRARGRRLFAVSDDNGESWPLEFRSTTLMEPYCNGDIILWTAPDGRELMLHSICDNPKERKNVSVFVSDNDGMTWHKAITLQEGDSAYSSLCVMPDGSVGALVEEAYEQPYNNDNGYNLVFHKIPACKFVKALEK